MTIKRILIVDDHPIVRSSLAMILKKIPEVELAGETDSGKICLRLARKLKPDLVILDYKLPDISGLEVTRRLLKQDSTLKVLALTGEDHLTAKHWLFAAGVHGYLNKSASLEEIILAITSILQKDYQVQVKSPSSSAEKILANLSSREAEIMRMMIYGDTIENIAKRLSLDIKTIYAYRSAIFKKMKLRSTIALTLFAWQAGIFSLEECLVPGLFEGDNSILNR